MSTLNLLSVLKLHFNGITRNFTSNNFLFSFPFFFFSSFHMLVLLFNIHLLHTRETNSQKHPYNYANTTHRTNTNIKEIPQCLPCLYVYLSFYLFNIFSLSGLFDVNRTYFVSESIISRTVFIIFFVVVSS